MFSTPFLSSPFYALLSASLNPSKLTGCFEI
jgi:hypothetical protein